MCFCFAFMLLHNSRKTLFPQMFTTVFTTTKSSIFVLNLYQVSKKINAGGKKKKKSLIWKSSREKTNKQTSAGELSAGMRESFISCQEGSDGDTPAQGKQVGTPRAPQPPEQLGAPALLPGGAAPLAGGTGACLCSCVPQEQQGLCLPQPAQVHRIREPQLFLLTQKPNSSCICTFSSNRRAQFVLRHQTNEDFTVRMNSK